MKVVLDANVIIAAFATRGLCADIFEYCLYEQHIVFSKTLLDEIHSNLSLEIKLPKDKVNEIINFLSSQGQAYKPQKISKDVCRDKDDLHILGLAIAAKADAIVTGDMDLLDLKQFYSIPILSPREFWNFIRKGRK